MRREYDEVARLALAHFPGKRQDVQLVRARVLASFGSVSSVSSALICSSAVDRRLHLQTVSIAGVMIVFFNGCSVSEHRKLRLSGVARRSVDPQRGPRCKVQEAFSESNVVLCGC